jgi:hypothetical protein
MTIHVAASWQVIAAVWAITVGIPLLYFALREKRLGWVEWASLIVLVAAAVGATLPATTARVVVDDRAIAFTGWFLDSTFDVAAVDFGHAVRFDANDASAAVRPVVRVWGEGMPGYCAGTFRLANGQRALVLTTSDDQVYVPTRGGEPFVVNAAVFEQIVSASGHRAAP